MYRILVPALLVALLAACASPTPYQPVREGYGYSQQRIEDNRYRVVFRGNSVTPRQVVEDYMLFNAAELTLKNGYDYFEVADRHVDKSTRYVATYNDFAYPTYFHRFPYDYYGGGMYTGDYRPIARYTATANIVLYHGRKPANKVAAYDARDVVQRLGPTIRRPPPPQP
jgi:hypothetical protein